VEREKNKKERKEGQTVWDANERSGICGCIIILVLFSYFFFYFFVFAFFL
jgi:hypothetical protein